MILDFWSNSSQKSKIIEVAGGLAAPRLRC